MIPFPIHIFEEEISSTTHLLFFFSFCFYRFVGDSGQVLVIGSNILGSVPNCLHFTLSQFFMFTHHFKCPFFQFLNESPFQVSIAFLRTYYILYIMLIKISFIYLNNWPPSYQRGTHISKIHLKIVPWGKQVCHSYHLTSYYQSFILIKFMKTWQLGETKLVTLII